MNLIKILLTLILFQSHQVLLAEETPDLKLETIASNLDHPWSAVYLPNSDILFTELSGSLRVIRNNQLVANLIKGMSDVLFAGQGGLSDIKLHPNYENNNLIYFSYSAKLSKKSSLSTLKVARGFFDGKSVKELEVIFTAEPYRTAPAHYGAKLLFLKDGTLLITSGDGFNYREQAQKLDNHFGKIIRINDDGTIPSDNPYLEVKGALPEIWSYGHRNMQGLVLGENGSVIYEIEHGPRGGDELNIIEPAKNYGWPAITYGIDYSGAMISPYTEMKGMEQPITYWVPSIAPSGIAYYSSDRYPEWKNNIFVSSLVPGELRRIVLSDRKVISEEILLNNQGRVRDVLTTPDGGLLVLIDGKNGKIIRINKN